MVYLHTVGPAAVESAVAFTTNFGCPSTETSWVSCFQDCTWWLLCIHLSGLTLSLDFVDHSTSYASYAVFLLGVSFVLSPPFRPQWRRRLRRARAIARYKWWLYRTGGIEQNLHVSVLSWILRTLSGHHSKDSKHLTAIRRQLNIAMAYTESQPWRCMPCRRLVKAKQQFCPNCGSWWEDVFDKDYQPSTPRQVKDQSWTWNSWQENPQRRPRTPARKQSRSTSASRKGKGGEKGRDKGKEKGKEKGKDKSQEQVSPFVNAALMVPLAPTPFPTMAELGNIIHAHGGCSSWCRTHSSHQEGLSGRIITSTGDQGRHSTKPKLLLPKTSTGRLLLWAERRSRSESWEEAKEKHRNQWLSHLKDALQSWQQQMQSYEDQQEAFNTAIVKAENGSEPISSVNPSLERESCRENTPRSSNSGVRWFGTPTGRRKIPKRKLSESKCIKHLHNVP